MPDKVKSPDKSRYQILLSEQQYYDIAKELDLLKNKINAQLVVFGDMNGQLICHKGMLPGVDLTILTALIGSDFSATSEIAKILGKDNAFRLHYHEGSKNHLYISSVSDQFFLSVVFDLNVTLGMVRIFTQKTIEKITKIVESGIQARTQFGDIIDSEFRTFVAEGLDKILG